jgi:hypothetical protein
MLHVVAIPASYVFTITRAAADSHTLLAEIR